MVTGQRPRLRHVERSKIVWRWDMDSEERWVDEDEEEEDMVVVIWKLNGYGHPVIITNDDHRQFT